MAEVRDVVVADYAAIRNAMLISEVSQVFKYESGKNTGEIEGYKGTFLVTNEKAKGLQIVVKVAQLNEPDWEMMKNYHFNFDTEKSTVYVQNGRMALSLWAKEVSEAK